MNRTILDAPWISEDIVDDMRQQLRIIFYRLIFFPLLKKLETFTSQKVRTNAMGALLSALRSGRIQYDANTEIVAGSFAVALTRDLLNLGATWDKRLKVFHLPLQKAPDWFQAEAAAWNQRARNAHEALLGELDKIKADQKRIEEMAKVNAEKIVGRTAKKYRVISEQLGISGVLTDDAKERLQREYVDSMTLNVKNFTEEMTDSLRTTIETNISAGYRYDKLIKGFEQRFAVTKNKAEFLARQETNLFMSKHREARFRSLGVERYRWSGSLDARERPDHKALEGKIFRWDDPPVVDRATGRRANPGEDYGCRCNARPVLDEIKETVNA